MKQKATAALLWSVAGYLACYLAAYLLGPPLLKYVPLDHAWTFVPAKGAIAMGYFGLLLYALAGAVLTFALAFMVPERILRNHLRHSVWTISLLSCFGLAAALLKEGLHWIF